MSENDDEERYYDEPLENTPSCPPGGEIKDGIGPGFHV